jgi:hypothetical protein
VAGFCKHGNEHVGFEVVVVVSMRNTVFRDVKPSSPDVSEGTASIIGLLACCMLLGLFIDPEDKPVHSCEALVSLYRLTRRHIPQDSTLEDNEPSGSIRDRGIL